MAPMNNCQAQRNFAGLRGDTGMATNFGCNFVRTFPQPFQLCFHVSQSHMQQRSPLEVESAANCKPQPPLCLALTFAAAKDENDVCERLRSPQGTFNVTHQYMAAFACSMRNIAIVAAPVRTPVARSRSNPAPDSVIRFLFYLRVLVPVHLFMHVGAHGPWQWRLESPLLTTTTRRRRTRGMAWKREQSCSALPSTGCTSRISRSSRCKRSVCKACAAPFSSAPSRFFTSNLSFSGLDLVVLVSSARQ